MFGLSTIRRLNNDAAADERKRLEAIEAAERRRLIRQLVDGTLAIEAFPLTIPAIVARVRASVPDVDKSEVQREIDRLVEAGEVEDVDGAYGKLSKPGYDKGTINAAFSDYIDELKAEP